MSCPNCFNNCDLIVSDDCIRYTGDSIPALGICTGQTLSQVEAIILTELQAVLNGTGINISSLTVGCDWMKAFITNNNTALSNLMQVLFDADCSLYQMIQNIESQIGQSYSFNTGCLTGLPANSGPNDVLQAAVTLLCSLNATVTAIASDYVKASQLNALVTTIIQNYTAQQQGSGGGTSIGQFYVNMPPKTAFPYFGDLSNFDNNGVGLPSKGFQNIYILNGLNGTPDWRGRSVVGAVNNIPGAAFPAATDPNNPANNNVNYSVGDMFGESSHVLIAQEMPAHSHGVNDAGHSHGLGPNGVVSYVGSSNSGNGHVSGGGNNGTSVALTQTDPAITGITITNAGGNLGHNNVQPSTAAIWVAAIY
jgi:microcystin-dependent protein